MMLALGLATQQAIGEIAGIAADLRWPNDVLIDGRKCAGVLAHLESGAIVGRHRHQRKSDADFRRISHLRQLLYGWRENREFRARICWSRW